MLTRHRRLLFEWGRASMFSTSAARFVYGPPQAQNVVDLFHENWA
jgi:hypothetical protein